MNKKTIRQFFIALCFFGIVVFTFSFAQAQADEGLIQRGNASSYKVYDATPVILDGPFLLDTSDTSTTVEWITDTPCQGRVEYEASWIMMKFLKKTASSQLAHFTASKSLDFFPDTPISIAWSPHAS